MHMWISDKWQDFELIDCSKGEKLERWGRFYLVRPAGNMGYAAQRRALEHARRALPQKPDRRRSVG